MHIPFFSALIFFMSLLQCCFTLAILLDGERDSHNALYSTRFQSRKESEEPVKATQNMLEGNAKSLKPRLDDLQQKLKKAIAKVKAREEKLPEVTLDSAKQQEMDKKVNVLKALSSENEAEAILQEARQAGENAKQDDAVAATAGKSSKSAKNAAEASMEIEVGEALVKEAKKEEEGAEGKVEQAKRT